MKILIVHAIDNIRGMRRSSVNHAFFLLKYAPEHTYSLHCHGHPISERLRRAKFDAIILDTTFLCWRWAQPRARYLDVILEDYHFIAASEAVKVALPQDEYDHSEILDEWLAAWRVDVIYSVCYEYRSAFYPRASRYAEIRQCLTGYVDDADVCVAQAMNRPFTEREIDVGYRARKLPPQFGRFGQMKGVIGELFLERMSSKPLKLDISLRPSDVLTGEDWLRFLANSRFTLGCESGSSLLDPRGELRKQILAYVEQHPTAVFEEVEAACFPGEDQRYLFSAISPRLFEAALARSCQILVPGNYLGVLRPDEHYIPVESDLSNANEVYSKMCDRPAVEARIEACYQALIGCNRFRYRCFKNDVLDAIVIHSKRKGYALASTENTSTTFLARPMGSVTERQGAVPSFDSDEGGQVSPIIRQAYFQVALQIAQESGEDLKELAVRLGVIPAQPVLLLFFKGVARSLFGVNNYVPGVPESSVRVRLYLLAKRVVSLLRLHA